MNRISTLLNTSRIVAASLLVFGSANAGTLTDSDSATSAEGYKAMSMNDDLAHRSPDIHWPAGFVPTNADLFAHNEMLINAPCGRVWKHIIWIRIGKAPSSCNSWSLVFFSPSVHRRCAVQDPRGARRRYRR
jgi:hypothetical protein